MTTYATPPLRPFSIALDRSSLKMTPPGPSVTRRMSDLEGLFADAHAWRRAVEEDDPVVYSVRSTPVPEVAGELPQSITTIRSGRLAGEFYFTKGHIHPVPEGEIYLGLSGEGGLLLFDGQDFEYLPMAPDRMGYIPPGWAHRSINTGTADYSFLAVYPGAAGHDYAWVLEHGFGARLFAGDSAPSLRDYRHPDRPLVRSTGTP